MSFRFAQPLFALLFLLLPFFVWMFWRGQWRESYRFSSLLWLERFGRRSWRERWHWIDAGLWLLGLGLCIAGAMQPQWGRQVTENLEEGIAIVLAVDVSRSMAALDFELDNRPSDRLSVVKHVIRQFIDKRRSDAIGMVIFGELAFTQCPLTTDERMLGQFLERLQIGVAGDGTAIGDGLAVAVKRVKDSKAKSKVIILLSDGVNNAGRLQPLQAGALAKDLGIKVYTIGVGSKGRVPFPEQTALGTRIVMADLGFDEESLHRIADTTGGYYWRASTTSELESIYTAIDQLEKTEIMTQEFSDYRELYPYGVIPGLVLLMLFPVLRLGLFKRWVGV